MISTLTAARVVVFSLLCGAGACWAFLSPSAQAIRPRLVEAVVLGRDDVVTPPPFENPRTNDAVSIDTNDGCLRVLGQRVLSQEVCPHLWGSRTFGAATKTYDLRKAASVDSDAVGAFLNFGKLPTAESRFDVRLGTLAAKHRVLSLSRMKRWWSAPAFDVIPLETQFLLVELTEEAPLYVLFLPLLSDDGLFRCTLWDGGGVKNGAARSLRARCESGDAQTKTSAAEGALWVGGVRGEDAASAAYSLVCKGLEAASKRKKAAFTTLRHKVLPKNLLEGLGWCTWDACYSAVDANQIDRGLRALRRNGVKCQRLIVDDGWMQLDREPPPTTIHDEGSALMSGQTLTGLSVSENVVATHLYDQDDASTADELRAVDNDHVVVVDTVVSRLARLASLSVQKSVATTVGKLYATYVESAPDDSLPVRLWRFASSHCGPLRRTLVLFFDENTDFTRRLTWPPTPHATKFGGADGFAKFLKTTVRDEHGVDFIACWHAIAGHWGGIDDDDHGVDSFKGDSLNAETVRSEAPPHLRYVEPSIAWDPASLKGMTTPTRPKDVRKLYEGLYGLLHSCGVDGVKADAQSGVGPLGHSKGGGPASVKVFVEAMEHAAGRYFSDPDKGDASLAVLNCMCHSTENLYAYAKTAVARFSDDFYPRDPSSWLYHVTACAYNSIFLGGLLWPDYDMFQTKHPAAWTHAAARAVSGSPVTISDEPGHHDPAVLRALALPSGHTFVAKAPGRVAADCLFADVAADLKTPLKIVAPSNACGSAVAGVFNVQGSSWSRAQRRYVSRTKKIPTLRGSLTPTDLLPAFQHDDVLDGPARDEAAQSANAALNTKNFVAWAFSGGKKVIDFRRADSYDFDLRNPGDFRVFGVARLRRIFDPRRNASWAPLGLVDMLNGGGAVQEVVERRDTGTASFDVLVRGQGTFAAFCDEQPVKVDGVNDVAYDEGSRLLTLDLQEDALHRLTFSW